MADSDAKLGRPASSSSIPSQFSISPAGANVNPFGGTRLRTLSIPSSHQRHPFATADVGQIRPTPMPPLARSATVIVANEDGPASPRDMVASGSIARGTFTPTERTGTPHEGISRNGRLPSISAGLSSVSTPNVSHISLATDHMTLASISPQTSILSESTKMSLPGSENGHLSPSSKRDYEKEKRRGLQTVLRIPRFLQSQSSSNSRETGQNPRSTNMDSRGETAGVKPALTSPQTKTRAQTTSVEEDWEDLDQRSPVPGSWTMLYPTVSAPSPPSPSKIRPKSVRPKPKINPNLATSPDPGASNLDIASAHPSTSDSSAAPVATSIPQPVFSSSQPKPVPPSGRHPERRSTQGSKSISSRFFGFMSQSSGAASAARAPHHGFGASAMEGDTSNAESDVNPASDPGPSSVSLGYDEPTLATKAPQPQLSNITRESAPRHPSHLGRTSVTTMGVVSSRNGAAKKEKRPSVQRPY
ncbi:hypothetical protein DL93DRAFT_2074295 [Clavulina sp. PMI_390]|nr:hypothetical protein DL93DRAFT_2074295 [Clavulina sp. PMI_390]